MGTSKHSHMRVAIVHDWLPLYGGAERVLEQIIYLYPDADLFSIVDLIPPGQRGFLQNKPVQTSFVQRLPRVRTHYRSYLPLMPIAVEQFDLSGYDLVISSSYAVAKGVITGPDQLHICYCHSPIRYAWDLQNQYLRETGAGRGFSGVLVRALLHYIRLWDVRTAQGVNEFVANSAFIARRIHKVYGRHAHVIHPPVDTDSFTLQSQKEDFYLTVSRQVPYKKVSLIVEAFAGMPDKQLVVIGDGPEAAKIKQLAGPNVKLLGYQPRHVVVDYMQNARAFIFAAEEDFGIVPVEAQACGTPVIAYGRGGATETVIPGVTGVLFAEQTVESIRGAVRELESQEFDPRYLHQHAGRFSAKRFRKEFGEFIEHQIRLFDDLRTSNLPVHLPSLFEHVAA